MLITTTLTACNNELQYAVKSNQTLLTIDVGITQASTRAIIEGTSFADDTEIGISVVDESGTTYDSQDYKNIKFTATTEEGIQKWNPDKQILLSGTDATLYAYHPYQQNTDLTAISVDMTEEDQKDWMYATPVESLSDAEPNAHVKLNHALINFKLTFIKENYTGVGEVTAISIQGDNIATGGTLNATSGSFTAFTGKGNELSRSVEYTLTESTQDATTFNIMAVPADTQGDLTVCLTVDGNNYTCKSKVNELLSGKSVIQSLKLTNTGLDLISLTITDWIEEDLGEADFIPDNNNAENSSDYIILTYDVQDTENIHNVFYYYDDDNKADLTLVDDIVIDGEAAQLDYTYKFDATGEHIIKILFKDKTTVPSGMFYQGTMVTAVIPDAVINIEDGAFAECFFLRELKLGSNLRTIGSSAFYSCQSLNTIKIESTNAPVIEDDTFSDVSENGSLYYPINADYSTWLSTTESGHLGFHFWNEARPNGVFFVDYKKRLSRETNPEIPHIAVALIVNDAPTPQSFWIEPYEEKNPLYAKANDKYESLEDYDEFFSWGGYYTNQSELYDYSTIDGVNELGDVPSDYKTWMGGALSDFNGL